MKKFWIQVIALVLVTMAGLFISFKTNLLKPIATTIPTVREESDKAIIKTADGRLVEIKVELADTSEKRALGLGGRESLSTDSGMLFILERESVPTFWMKGLKFPLDFIWIRDDTIVDLLPHVPTVITGTSDDQLPRYRPVTAVDRVLEVNAGFIIQKGLKIGDKIELKRASE